MPLFTPETSRRLSQTLGLITYRFPEIVDNIIEKTPSGSYVKVTMAVVGGGTVPASREYASPRKLPESPDLYYCTKAYKNGDLENELERSGAGDRTNKTRSDGSFTAVRPLETVRAQPASGLSEAGRWLPVLPVVLVAVVLALNARLALVIFRRRTGR